MKLSKIILAALIIPFICSCKSLASDDSDDFAKDISSFIEFNNWGMGSRQSSLNETIDLYVDYSTCVSEAQKSAYYRTVHPVIVDANPSYYSIKGSNIKFETNNRQAVYQLLNTVKEVNYADIKGAVKKIVEGDNHAVLITDGEYYQPNSAVKDSQTNPYLADEFRKWLNRGLDIYIYSEPYLESGKHNKFRYYMFFTDDNCSNNIRERFQRSVPEQSDVKMFHLSGKRPAVIASSNYPVVDPSLSPNTQMNCKGNGYDVQEYYTEWDDIYNYLVDNASDERGNQIADGMPVARGLFVDNDHTNGYKVKDLTIRVTNIGNSFTAWRDARNAAQESDDNSIEIPKAGQLPSCKLFTYDKKLFEETGEIVLMLDKNNKYDGLMDTPNLLKVDIIADKVVENFTQNNEHNGSFQWYSITQNNQLNTSLYESIRLVLLDPNMNPTRKDKVLYTIYMSTYGL